MKIGTYVTMNEFSSHQGQRAKIIHIDSDYTNFIIEFEDGLVIKAPKDVLIFDTTN